MGHLATLFDLRHFYAGTHGQYLRDKAQAALDRGIALFVSEWGTLHTEEVTFSDLLDVIECA